MCFRRRNKVDVETTEYDNRTTTNSSIKMYVKRRNTTVVEGSIEYEKTISVRKETEESNGNSIVYSSPTTTIA